MTRTKGRAQPIKRTRLRTLRPIYAHTWELECLECGQTFTAHRSDAKYHSPACRARAFRRRKAAADLQAFLTATEPLFYDPIHPDEPKQRHGSAFPWSTKTP